MHWYQSCLEAILQNSPDAKIFCLTHKMDLIQEDQRDLVCRVKNQKWNKLNWPSISLDFQRTWKWFEASVQATWMYLFSDINLGWNSVQSVVNNCSFTDPKCARTWKSSKTFCWIDWSWRSASVWTSNFPCYFILPTEGPQGYSCELIKVLQFSILNFFLPNLEIWKSIKYN